MIEFSRLPVAHAARPARLPLPPAVLGGRHHGGPQDPPTYARMLGPRDRTDKKLNSEESDL